MKEQQSNEVQIQTWGRPQISYSTPLVRRWDLRGSILVLARGPSVHPSLTQSLCSRVKHLMMIEGSLQVQMYAIAATHLLKSVTASSLISRACRKTVVLSNAMAHSPPILSKDWIRMRPAPPATLTKTQASLKHITPLSHNRVRITRTNLKRQQCKLRINLTQATETICRAPRFHHRKIKNSRKSWLREMTSWSSMFRVLLRRSNV